MTKHSVICKLNNNNNNDNNNNNNNNNNNLPIYIALIYIF